MIRRLALLFGTVGLAMSSLAGVPAAAEGSPPDSLATLPAIPVDDGKNGGNLDGQKAADDTGAGLPRAVLPAVAAVKDLKWADAVNDVVWEAANELLTVYVSSNQAAIEKEVAQADQNGAVRVRVVKSFRSLEEIDTAVFSLISKDGKLADGTQVSTWYPSHDGRQVTFEVAGAGLRSKTLKLPTELDGIKTNFKFGHTVTPATRVDNSPGVAGGASMHGQGYVCTTGFPIVHSSQPATGFGNLTADHCGSGEGSPWYWGTWSSEVVGQTVGQVPYSTGDVGTDLEGLLWGDSVTGSMAWGGHTSFSYYPINGYFAAVVGQNVCYNGSQTGTWCSNEVININTAACYGDGLPCYRVTRTEQVAGISSVGNGDSGGPVGLLTTRPSDGRQGFYGTGIISGMVDPDSDCNGDPSSSTRKCSSIGLMSPVERFYEVNNTWQLVTAS